MEIRHGFILQPSKGEIVFSQIYISTRNDYLVRFIFNMFIMHFYISHTDPKFFGKSH